MTERGHKSYKYFLVVKNLNARFKEVLIIYTVCTWKMLYRAWKKEVMMKMEKLGSHDIPGQQHQNEPSVLKLQQHTAETNQSY